VVVVEGEEGEKDLEEHQENLPTKIKVPDGLVHDERKGTHIRIPHKHLKAVTGKDLLQPRGAADPEHVSRRYLHDMWEGGHNVEPVVGTRRPIIVP
jgi:hypothetical protein